MRRTCADAGETGQLRDEVLDRRAEERGDGEPTRRARGLDGGVVAFPVTIAAPMPRDHPPDGTETAPDHPLGDYPAFKWRHFLDVDPTFGAHHPEELARAAVEKEREDFGSLGGVDPIFVALTARATARGLERFSPRTPERALIDPQQVTGGTSWDRPAWSVGAQRSGRRSTRPAPGPGSGPGYHPLGTRAAVPFAREGCGWTSSTSRRRARHAPARHRLVAHAPGARQGSHRAARPAHRGETASASRVCPAAHRPAQRVAAESERTADTIRGPNAYARRRVRRRDRACSCQMRKERRRFRALP